MNHNIFNRWRTYLTGGGTDKSSALQKTCCILSPGMPQFSAFYSLKYFFHTVWYLLQVATIESPINSTEECNFFARISWLLLDLYQPFCYFRLVLLLSHMIDCICSLWRQKMQWYATVTIAIHGLWSSTNANFGTEKR